MPLLTMVVLAESLKQLDNDFTQDRLHSRYKRRRPDGWTGVGLRLWFKLRS